MAHPHGLRLGDLPVRRRAAGQVLARSGDQLGAARLAAQEHLLLVGDQLVDRVRTGLSITDEATGNLRSNAVRTCEKRRASY